MFNLILYFCLHADKHLAVSSWRTSATRSIHIFGHSLLFFYCPDLASPFYVKCYNLRISRFVVILTTITVNKSQHNVSTTMFSKLCSIVSIF